MSSGGLLIRGGSADVAIVAGRIMRVVDDQQGGAASSQAVLDATGCFVVPGFIDVQINGAFGVDFTHQPERVAEVAARLPEMGVTSFLPTVITAAPEVTARAVRELDAARTAAREGAGSRILGAHLEGPFINHERRGAHPSHHVRPPSRSEAQSWAADAGVAMVTLAPELPGAIELISDLTSRGVVVSLGHTAASFADIDAAASAGATGATHLYNAMGSMSAREPGTIAPLLRHPSMICGLIVDGVHVDPLMVALAWQQLGDRLMLVTDAVAALGLRRDDGHDGRAFAGNIGDTGVIVDRDSVRTANGVLAGSILAMDNALRNLIAFTGCTLTEAVQAASATPAALLGRTDLGTLRPGAAGDVVLLDEQARVVATVVGGTIAHDPDGRCGAGAA
jgi:N-acetylglucosamine-6-phosphate deacetylase